MVVGGFAFRKYKAHLLMVLNEFTAAGSLILLQLVLSKGIDSLVLVVYEHIISTLFLSTLAFFLDKGKRPPISFQIICWAFFLGLLEITLCQLLLTMALDFTTANNLSIALNMLTAVVFVLSVLFLKEKFSIVSIYGQAKLWGVVVSVGGAMTMLLWTGPKLFKSTLLWDFAFGGFRAIGDTVIGNILSALGVLSAAAWNILVGSLSRKYPPLSSTALMTFFGTIQTAIVGAFLVPRASWAIGTKGGLEIFTIIFLGIIGTGLSYYVLVWCIDKKGPVFMAAFRPLLILFSVLLEALVLRKAIYLGSILGAFMVVGGLYLLLWAKASESEEMLEDGSINSPLIANQQDV